MGKPVKKTKEISIKVGLDENNVPVKMQWKSDDAKQVKWKESKAMLLSLFEPDTMSKCRSLFSILGNERK